MSRTQNGLRVAILIKIKIANVIEDGRLAGPQLRIVNVAQRLNPNKYSTTVILPVEENKDFIEKLKLSKVAYKEISLHRLTFNISHLIAFILLFVPEVVGLYRYFRSNDFDIIHVSGGSWQWKGVIAGKLAGSRVLWHLNDTQMPKPIKVIFKLLARFFCDGLIVAGKRVEDYYVQDMGVEAKENCHIIQAPVDCYDFDPSKVVYCSNIPKDGRINVMTIANINRIKGIELLIDTAKTMEKLNPEIIFYVIGPVFDSQKEYYKKLKKKIEKLALNNIVFCGPSSDVKSSLIACDIYFCTSLAEASPMAVWEAMSMGKPIVSTSVGDVPYYVKNGVNGYVCNIGDFKSLAKSIAFLSQNAKQRALMGMKSREIAIENFDISVCVAKHEIAYSSFFNYVS